MAQLSKIDPGAVNAYERWTSHSWYLDPTVVPFVLANSNWALQSNEMENIAQKIFQIERPNFYSLERKNNTGFLPNISQMLVFDAPPSLSDYISEESWLIFDILGHSTSQCKWMLLPSSTWHLDPDFQQFQKFVKSAAVVNDSSERAVKLVQETVSQTISEKKLQKMFLVKSKIDKPKNRTKKAYREASSSLTPSEQLDLVFGLTTSADEEMEISSNSEMDSSMEIVDDEEVVDALVEENECF